MRCAEMTDFPTEELCQQATIRATLQTESRDSGQGHTERRKGSKIADRQRSSLCARQTSAKPPRCGFLQETKTTTHDISTVSML